MMRVRTLSAAMALMMAVGCVTYVHRPAEPVVEPPPPPPNEVEPKYPLVPAEYAPFAGSGNGVIEGQAFLKTRGGSVITAAGNEVILDPFTTFAREFWMLRHLDFEELWAKGSANSTFAGLRRTTRADAEGRFHFSELPAGTYYIHSLVTWMAGRDKQGGIVGDTVSARKDRKAELIISSERDP